MAPSLLAIGTPPPTAVAATNRASVLPRKVYTLSAPYSSSSCFCSRNWQTFAGISHRSAAAAGHGISSLDKAAATSHLHGSGVAPEEALRTRTKLRIRAKVEDIEAEEDLETGDHFVERKRPLRPVVERFNIYHEKNITEERMKELGVSRWSKWDCGPGVTYFWQWKVDELVYISKGSVEVVPDGCYDGAFFYAGDLVHFPKWFEGTLTFDEDYEQHYKFLAYGDS